MKQQSRAVKRIVPRLLTRPTLSWHHQPYYKAFLELHRKRQVAFSQLPIPGSEIWAYIQVHELHDDAEFYYRAISELDHEYMKFTNEKAEREKKAKDLTAKRKPPPVPRPPRR